MSVRAGLALAFWLLILALLSANVGLGLRNNVAGTADAISVLALLAFGTVGPLIVVRRPENAIGWLFCLDVVLNTVASVAHEAVHFTLITQPGALPGADWLAWLTGTIGDSGWALMFTFTFLLFPTGRLPSRRWRPLAWLITVVIVFHTLVSAFRPGYFSEWPTLANPLGRPLPPALLRLDDSLGEVVIFFVMASLASLVLRLRTIRGDQRQQIKWIAYVAAILLTLIGSDLAAAPADGTPLRVLMDVSLIAAFTAFPVAIGLSILRYRLWDIDVLIRRTLVYGALTAALALLYGGTTILFEQLFRSLTRQDSQLVIVLSTLVIAVAFAPLRRRIQSAIDRRFYRRTVDAAQTLAAFSTTARDEVDLDRLTQALLDSVGVAFRPAHVSLWLPEGRQPPPRTKP